MNVLNLNTLEFHSVKGDYGYVEFNGIKLYVTSDKQWFCATRLAAALKEGQVKDPKSSGNKWWDTNKPKIDAEWPDLWKRVDADKCSQCATGTYIHIS